VSTAGFDPALLPGAEESMRCAAYSEMLDLDPIGSALHVDEVVVIDVALPWPKPVWAVEGFTFVPESITLEAEKGRRVRALAAVPDDDDQHRVVWHSRGHEVAAASRVEFLAPPSEIPRIAAAVIGGDTASVDQYRIIATVKPEVLVCTQGSHDVCCGSSGVPFAADLVAARPNITVRRVSHTGGHRFAPTALTFPGFRMWGRLDLADMLAIVDRTGRPSAVEHRCRGWLGADGPGQVAERAVMMVIDDWDFDFRDRHVVVEETSEGWECQVDVDGRVWVVDVRLSREVPSIACGAPGGLPAKPGREYRVVAEPREVVAP